MHNGALKKWAMALTFWIALHTASLRAQIFTAPLQASTTGTNPVDFEFRADGTLISKGNYGVGSLASGDQGEGTRFLWFPSLGAFRAGGTSGSEWDTSNLGSYSSAFGYGTTASGSISTAFGGATTASGAYAVSFGYNTLAQAKLSFVIGQFNLGGGSTTDWVATDPLFEIGNGTSSSALSDAFVVYKNGNSTSNGTDNEMPNQTLVGPGSVMTEGLADLRYASASSISTGSAYYTGPNRYGTTGPTLGFGGGSSTAPYSIAFGQGSSASGYGAIAIGASASSSTSSIAIGGSSSSGWAATAIGYSSATANCRDSDW